MEEKIYTPYDGSATPFTIGLKPLAEREWMEIHPDLTQRLCKRQQILQSRRTDVLSTPPDDPATAELLEMVLQNLKKHHPDIYDFSQDQVRIMGGPPQSIDHTHPLESLAQLVDEDFCLIRKKDEGHFLAAALLCFPSSWRLKDKIGKSLEGVHAPVPDYAGPMSQRVNLLFDRLRPEQIVWRLNWSLDEGPDLYRPTPHSHDQWIEQGGDPAEHIYVRVERQTFRRLPQAGDIVFTIHIQMVQLAQLIANKPQAEKLSGLYTQLANLTEEQCRYKGLLAARPLILERLQPFHTS